LNKYRLQLIESIFAFHVRKLDAIAAVKEIKESLLLNLEITFVPVGFDIQWGLVFIFTTKLI